MWSLHYGGGNVCMTEWLCACDITEGNVRVRCLSYLKLGQSWGWIIKFVITCEILSFSEKLVVNACFSQLYSLILPLSISNNFNNGLVLEHSFQKVDCEFAGELRQACGCALGVQWNQLPMTVNILVNVHTCPVGRLSGLLEWQKQPILSFLAYLSYLIYFYNLLWNIISWNGQRPGRFWMLPLPLAIFLRVTWWLRQQNLPGLSIL